MDNRQLEALKGLDSALPQLDDFSRGYILGIAEEAARRKEKEGGQEGNREDSEAGC
jgi:hypothetical protein